MIKKIHAALEQFSHNDALVEEIVRENALNIAEHVASFFPVKVGAKKDD